MTMLVALAGCSTRNVPTGFTDASGVQSEYQDELSHLEFPPGFSPPQQPPQGEQAATYEVGFGRSTADFVWLCAWSQEWIEQHVGDEVRATHALDVLRGFPSLDLWNHMDASGRQTILDAVDAAHSGDASGLQDQIRFLGCAELTH